MSSESSPISIVAAELKQKLGADNVISDAGDLAKFGGDKWFASHQPDLAVFPRNAEETSLVMRLAHENEIPVTTRGAGYGYVGGCVPVRGGIVLGVRNLTRIKEIHNTDFVAVVEPGVITGDLQDAVQAQKLFYPPDPASLRDCSIGGNIATNAGGPRCLKYGVTRSYVLGLEVVLPGGDVVRCGGRTHKNKTGFDLVGLFCGSEGLLGVITEATLRLLPLPPARASVSAGFVDMAAAAKALQAVFAEGFLPAALEVADGFTLNAARNYKPGAHFPPGDALLLLDLDGQRESVMNEARVLGRLLESCGSTGVEVATTEADREKIWDLRRAFSQSLKATGLRKLNEDIVVPRGRLVDLVNFARDLQARSGFPIACFGHAGDGNIHTNIMVGDYDNPEIRARADAALDELFGQIIAWEGAITGEHGIGLAKMRWWDKALSAENRALHQRIKQAVDPKNLLNPGKFVSLD
ncbi:FAD/FMN-containing dehydrogenase [Spartobacteria bacterium LR76]|nr:FAD/FMN-containing dehydrogenase [Spartobacteria bacterium LR76]